MDAEIEGYSRQIRSLLERVCASSDGLRESQLNWRPSFEGANSMFVIVRHVLGNAEAWVLGIACGRPVERDRPGEFRASGGGEELVARAAALYAEIESALAALPTRELERRLVPAQSLWGEGEPREISVREALVEVIEHASIHLGQLQITRDLALGEARG